MVDIQFNFSHKFASSGVSQTIYIFFLLHALYNLCFVWLWCDSQTNMHMMTSSNGNNHRWIPLTKASDAELWFFCAWTNGWVNNRDVGDLERHRAHYDVTVVECSPVNWGMTHRWVHTHCINVLVSDGVGAWMSFQEAGNSWHLTNNRIPKYRFMSTYLFRNP